MLIFQYITLSILKTRIIIHFNESLILVEKILFLQPDFFANRQFLMK